MAKTAVSKKSLGGLFMETGSTGLTQYAGRVDEEFLRALSGSRRAKTLQEMSENDPVIGAALLGCNQMMLSANYRVQPAGDAKEDIEAAEFLESCMNDMSHTWDEFRTENLSRFIYGWSYHEIVYKKRNGPQREDGEVPSSQFDDGRIGWRKLAPRSQTTLDRWEFDDEGGVKGLWQAAPPDNQPTFIPIFKALHFTTDRRKSNPEGRSILRNCYTSYAKKKKMENIEAIGFARDLAGYPVLYVPNDLDIFNTDDSDMVALLGDCKKLVTRIKRDELEGAVFPDGWRLELLSSGGSRQINTSEIITRYDQRIALSLLTQFLLLGMDRVGSYDLAKEQKNVWLLALMGWLKSEAAVLNRYAIPRLFALNDFGKLSGYPMLIPDNIAQLDVLALADALQKLISVGGVTPDLTLEEFSRKRLGAPELPKDEEAKPKVDTGDKETAAQAQATEKAATRPQWSIRDALEQDFEEDESLAIVGGKEAK
jgi:hypothetical protein